METFYLSFDDAVMLIAEQLYTMRRFVAAVQEEGGADCPEAGRLVEHSYSIPGCLTPPDDSPAVSTPGHVTPYVSPPSSPPTLTPQRPLSPRTPELPSCPDTPKYKTNMLYRYLQDAAEAHESLAEDSR
jgi:hypothetical protein